MSLWYAAHILMYVKRKGKPARKIPIWENIVLIKAASDDEAFAKAERLGKEGEGDDDGTFRWEGHPAQWVFAGVRKLTLCDDPQKRPGDGVEITYNEMEVASERAVRDLVNGKPAAVKLSVTFADEPDHVTPETPTSQGKQNGKVAPIKQSA
jgi:hypothetical protein